LAETPSSALKERGPVAEDAVRVMRAKLAKGLKVPLHLGGRNVPLMVFRDYNCFVFRRLANRKRARLGRISEVVHPEARRMQFAAVRGMIDDVTDPALVGLHKSDSAALSPNRNSDASFSQDPHRPEARASPAEGLQDSFE
jgi:hypothetical protein